MGSASGANTRRYHGLLVAAVRPPETREVLLANVEAEIRGSGSAIGLSCNQYTGAVHPEGYQFLDEFSAGRTVRWRFRAAGMQIEKELALVPGENTSHLRYTNTGSAPFRLTLRPLVSHKFYHDNFRSEPDYPSLLRHRSGLTQISHDDIDLYLRHAGAHVQAVAGWYYRFEHMVEIERGLDPRDDLFCPCELNWDLDPGESAVLTASTLESPTMTAEWETDDEVFPGNVINGLREAAAHYFVSTPTRTSIIAGYPWFTDWGRDTMISIPGLCLCTGRIETAKKIVRDYASQMRQGLIPNRFVEVGEEPEYNTVDATLWFANAIYQILHTEWDAEFAQSAAGWLREVFDWHTKGTKYGIKVDPADGLLSQGEEGVQLTWMDAKIGDWVVTPRRGKPVEINGLWINALRVMEWIANKLGTDAKPYSEAAEKAESHFEKKFFKASLGYYLDTVDPDDASLRPNQLIAMSLPFGPAKGEAAREALGHVSRELLTPVGMRTLGPESSEYQGRFRGPVEELDAAYHQGTVWPWLIGPYIEALVKINGDKVEARRIVRHARELLVERGLGGIAEVYDGDEPRGASGCPWQAWSVAEWLRAWDLVHADRG